MRSAGIVLALMVFLSACAHQKRAAVPPPPPVPTTPPQPSPGVAPTPQLPAQPLYAEAGLASWYGHPYHGRPAADGEIYDMEQMVAAHRTLPFNTWVRVFDLDNDKSIDLRIIDRGPFVDGRIIDLSHAAALAIDMVRPGTARVRVEVIRWPELLEASIFAVQVGLFRNRGNAERLRQEMESRYGMARVILRAGDPDEWCVLVGSQSTENQAKALAARIREESGEKSAAFVVRVDST
ncbi:MAG TPA: septal ring lytic transglycosylase RlpA family protein [Bryobacteraceae bacterium]|nr:septal ring lytic transglycosylase RlpA family protein [Bryobacteraceae bacterium]